MYYNSIIKTDLVNGPGIRVTLFVSGCTLNCDGCFNKAAQNFRLGTVYTSDTEEQILDLLDSEYVDGLSILGGDPCHHKNIYTVTNLIQHVRDRLPEKTIYVWSGYTLEDMQQRTDCKQLLKLVDVLIDGPYIHDKHTSTLRWRGSSNQRVLVRGEDF